MCRNTIRLFFDLDGFETGNGDRHIRLGRGARYVMIAIADLKSSVQVLSERLSSIGQTISGPDARGLLERISGINDWKPVIAAERPGWFDDCYVMPDRKVYRPTGSKAMVNILFTPETGRCAKAGSLSAWRRSIAARLDNNPYAQFALMLVFTGPILQLHGRHNNILFEFSGASSVGKSSVMKLAASVWGGPCTDGPITATG